MTREFKVGDRVRVAVGCNRGREGVIKSLGTYYDFHVKFSSLEGAPYRAEELTHAEPVPIGYTGKLRDMDLHEGDVVENEVSGVHYTMREDKHGVLKCCLITVNESTQDYTLISRANTAQETPPDQWSDWQLSRKDGTMSQQYAEVQTVPLEDTQQVVYRGRGKPVRREVMTVSVAIVDGQPDWDTVEEVVL